MELVEVFEKLRQLNIAIASTDVIQVHDINGGVVYSSPSPAYLKAQWPDRDCRERCYGLVWQEGHAVRTLDHIVTLEGRPYRLSLSGKIDEHFELLNAVRNAFLILCPLVLLFSVGGGFVLSGRALEPVNRITVEARSISIPT